MAEAKKNTPKEEFGKPSDADAVVVGQAEEKPERKEVESGQVDVTKLAGYEEPSSSYVHKPEVLTSRKRDDSQEK